METGSSAAAGSHTWGRATNMPRVCYSAHTNTHSTRFSLRSTVVSYSFKTRYSCAVTVEFIGKNSTYMLLSNCKGIAGDVSAGFTVYHHHTTLQKVKREFSLVRIVQHYPVLLILKQCGSWLLQIQLWSRWRQETGLWRLCLVANLLPRASH